MIGLIRWGTYCSRYQPPISTWGRLWTGWWIIPGYDYVLIAPIVTTLVGIVVPMGLKAAGMEPPATVGATAAMVLVCALNLGPTLRTWQLTGHHRILIAPSSAGAAQRRRAKGQSAEES